MNGKPEDVDEDHIGFLVRNARNVSDVARLQAVVRTLAEFDEVVDKNSRSKSKGLPMLHYLRRAFAAAEPEEVRAVAIFIGEDNFFVQCWLTTRHSSAMTVFFLEDQIAREKRDADNNPNHPVHELDHVSKIWLDSAKIGLSDAARILYNLPEGVIESLRTAASSRGVI